MSTHFGVDRESFQNLLANAFAVQESGLDPKSLSSLLELQRSIAAGGPDVDRTMNQVAERARTVANADGIAIALVRGNQLMYRAGSGSGAATVGRNVTAILSASAHMKAKGEILRVENAQTDGRIEGAICRQFEAESLLILPIVQKHEVAGILQVFFREPHSFQEREVRTYRLMARFIEEAIFRSAGLDRKIAQVPEPATVQHAIARVTSQAQVPRNDKSAAGPAHPGPTHDDWFGQIIGPVVATAQKSEDPSLPTNLVQAIKTEMKVFLSRELSRSIAATALGAALLVAACLISYERSPVSPVGTGSSLHGSTATPPQMAVSGAKQSPSKRLSRLRTVHGGSEKVKAPSSAFRRVQVGPYEVDYITGDVTIRHFLPHPAPRPVRRAENEVHFGPDVTVRSFSSKPAVVPPTRSVSTAAQAVDRSLPASK